MLSDRDENWATYSPMGWYISPKKLIHFVKYLLMWRGSNFRGFDGMPYFQTFLIFFLMRQTKFPVKCFRCRFFYHFSEVQTNFKKNRMIFKNQT